MQSDEGEAAPMLMPRKAASDKGHFLPLDAVAMSLNARAQERVTCTFRFLVEVFWEALKLPGGRLAMLTSSIYVRGRWQGSG